MNKTELIKVRLEPNEKRAFEEAAEIAGISLSAWMRERLRRAVIRELEDASRPIYFLPSRRAGVER
jgi:uncharacterized protein (DUF1778 family)